MKDVRIPSTADGTQQGALWFDGGASGPRPLVVGLHQWSSGYQHDFSQRYFEACRERRWALIHPDFRGPNNRPQACASPLAIRDVLDAVDFARANADIDEKRIYVIGASGGGHMTLMMAAAAPKLWAAASAWVPVTDLFTKHAHSKAAENRYWKMIEACCGGAPGTSEAADAEYRNRSPRFWLHQAAGLPIDINAGIHDGHTGSVPVSQSLVAFNVLADANGRADARLTDDQIRRFVADRAVPQELRSETVDEPERKHEVLFRRIAGPARVTIFEGGHEIDVPTAFAWLAAQQAP